MNYIINSLQYTHRKSEFATLKIGQYSAYFNKLAEGLLPNNYWGAKFHQEDGTWYVKFVKENRNKQTFGISRNDNVTCINGKLLAVNIGQGYYELIATNNKDEYQLKFFAA